MEYYIKFDELYSKEIAGFYQRAITSELWNDVRSDNIQLEEYIKDVSNYFTGLNYGLTTDGKLVAVSLGSIRHWRKGANYYIEEFCVNPTQQEMGISSKFMSMTENDIKKNELAGIFLQTNEDKPLY